MLPVGWFGDAFTAEMHCAEQTDDPLVELQVIAQLTGFMMHQLNLIHNPLASNRQLLVAAVWDSLFSTHIVASVYWCSLSSASLSLGWRCRLSLVRSGCLPRPAAITACVCGMCASSLKGPSRSALSLTPSPARAPTLHLMVQPHCHHCIADMHTASFRFEIIRMPTCMQSIITLGLMAFLLHFGMIVWYCFASVLGQIAQMQHDTAQHAKLS